MRKDELHDLLDDDHLEHTLPIASSQLKQLLAQPDGQASAPPPEPKFAPLVRAKRPSTGDHGLTDDDLDGGATLIDRKPPVITEPDPPAYDAKFDPDIDVDVELQTMTTQLDQKDLAKLLGAVAMDDADPDEGEK